MTNNKKWLFILFTIILTTISGCNKDNKQVIESSKEITMFVATDLHYLATDLNDHGEAFQTYMKNSDGKILGYVDEIVNAFTNEVINEKPEILIISGDLTNNGEKESHIKLAEKLKEVEKLAGTRIYVIPGNHDIQNPWARGFQGTEQYVTDTIGADEFEKIYNDYGYGEAISRDKASLSYLAAPSDDLWLLMLDTSIYDFNDMMGSPYPNGEIDPETFQWIKQCSKLAKKKNAKIVTVMHHNLFDHSERINKGFTLDNNEEALEVFKKNGLNLVLSGHIHIQDIKSSNDQNPIYDIVTSSLDVYPVQYGVLKFIPSQGLEYSTTQVDVEKWAYDNEVDDENLINFKEYSKEYSSEASYNKTYKALDEVESLSEHEKNLMAETVSLLHINYFAGTLDTFKDEVINSEGYNLWVNADEPKSLKSYVLSMIQNSNINNNELFLPNN